MAYRRTFLHTSTHKNTSIYRHSYSAEKKLSLTEGPIFVKILAFILPLIVTNLLQVLYNAADMIIVSFSSEANAVGAIGTTSSFINLIVNIFMGFALGANVMVAKYLGAKDDEKVSRSVHTAISMSVIFGIGSAVLGFFISRPILSLMGAQGNLLDLAVRYTIIYFAGAPFISATNYLIAIFRAKGDTKTPLIILTISGLVNVVLNVFFVFALDMSVEGVAIATSVSNAVSAILLFMRLSKDETACRFSLRKLCIDRKAFGKILKIGIPAGIQGSLFSLSNMTIQSSILQVNNATLAANSALVTPGVAFDPVVAGNAAATNLENFIYTAQNSVYQAAITFTSQNLGAKKPKRIFRILGLSYILGLAITVIVGGILFILREPLLGLYGVREGLELSLEHIAYETAIKRMLYLFLSYPLLSLMETGCGVVRGLGKSISSMFISLVGACLFRVVWIMTVFKSVETLDVVYMSYPISWVITSVTFFVYAMVVIKRYVKKYQETKTEAPQMQTA